MIYLTKTIIKGSGTLPKDIARNSVIYLDASSTTATTFEWEFISKPEDSFAVFSSPISSRTRVGTLDKTGVYYIKLVVDRNMSSEQQKAFALSVPVSTAVAPNPPTPQFSFSGGLVDNGSFELPGPLDGWAASWTLRDDSDVLATRAGTTRGRCIPTNFNTRGTYAFVLGDDIGGTVDADVGDVFEISQSLDFTNATRLTMVIKFRKGS